jgi:hypothetical protein
MAINVELAFSSYASSADGDQSRTAGAQKKEIQDFLDRSQLLEECLDRISLETRLAVWNATYRKVQEKWVPTALSLPQVNLIDLKRQLHALNSRLRIVNNEAAAGKGGRRNKDNLRNLLLRISIAWFTATPNQKGVTKSEDTYRGPLLDLIAKLLEIDGVDIRTNAARIGKMLYAVREQAQSMAEQPPNISYIEGL